MTPDIPTTPETAEVLARREAAARRLQNRKKLHFWALIATWIAAAAVIRFVGLTAWARALVAAAPLIPLAALIVYLREYSRHFDEFGRRIVVNAAAACFGIVVVLAFVYSLARMADIGVPRADWQPILMTMWILFPIAVAGATRRFK